MEKWYEIEKDRIPFGDYSIDCYLSDSGELRIKFIGVERFEIQIGNVVAFRIIDESSELRDPYAVVGLAKNRPKYLTNYVYEVENAEFGDLIKNIDRDESKFRHYKMMSMNYLIDIVSDCKLHIERMP